MVNEADLIKEMLSIGRSRKQIRMDINYAGPDLERQAWLAKDLRMCRALPGQQNHFPTNDFGTVQNARRILNSYAAQMAVYVVEMGGPVVPCEPSGNLLMCKVNSHEALRLVLYSILLYGADYSTCQKWWNSERVAHTGFCEGCHGE